MTQIAEAVSPTRPLGWRPLYFVPIVAACVIVALVTYKLLQPPQKQPEVGNVNVVRAAPLFQMYDQNSEIVRLQRYIGRHKLIVIFFDGSKGAAESQLLEQVRGSIGKLLESRAIVIAVSGLRPSEHRAAIELNGAYPFLMLSDMLDFEVHRRWGAYNPQTEQPLEGVFIVDRTGWIRHSHVGSELGTPDDWVKELAAIR